MTRLEALQAALLLLRGEYLRRVPEDVQRIDIIDHVDAALLEARAKAQVVSAEATLDDARRLLDLAVAAKRVGVSPRTLRRWCVAGTVRHTRTAGGHYRVLASEIARLTAGA